MRLALMLVFLAVAAAADAQVALDWTDGQGSIRFPAARAVSGDPAEVLRCRVRIPSASWSITVTGAPLVERTFAAPEHAVQDHAAFAECEGDLAPGVYGSSTPSTPVRLRRPAPSALGPPTLLP